MPTRFGDRSDDNCFVGENAEYGEGFEFDDMLRYDPKNELGCEPAIKINIVRRFTKTKA